MEVFSVGRYGAFLISAGSSYRAWRAGALEPWVTNQRCDSSVSRNFRKSKAVALWAEKALMAALWPPRLDAPGFPASPGSGATANLPFTLELPSVVARLYT